MDMHRDAGARTRMENPLSAAVERGARGGGGARYGFTVAAYFALLFAIASTTADLTAL